MSDQVTIDESELERLRDDSRFLAALYAAGVESWEGYEVAQDSLMEQS